MFSKEWKAAHEAGHCFACTPEALCVQTIPLQQMPKQVLLMHFDTHQWLQPSCLMGETNRKWTPSLWHAQMAGIETFGGAEVTLMQHKVSRNSFTSRYHSELPKSVFLSETMLRAQAPCELSSLQCCKSARGPKGSTPPSSLCIRWKNSVCMSNRISRLLLRGDISLCAWCVNTFWEISNVVFPTADIKLNSLHANKRTLAN